MGCCFLLQGIFLTQGSNLCLLCLLHCRQILYPLSHLGSPLMDIHDSKDSLNLFTSIFLFLFPFLPSFLSPFSFLSFCLHLFEFAFKNLHQDLPGSPGVKNLPANAEDPGSILGLGRLHMPQGNLSPCATATETCAGSPCSPKREAAIVRGLCTAARE